MQFLIKNIDQTCDEKVITVLRLVQMEHLVEKANGLDVRLDWNWLVIKNEMNLNDTVCYCEVCLHCYHCYHCYIFFVILIVLIVIIYNVLFVIRTILLCVGMTYCLLERCKDYHSPGYFIIVPNTLV